MPVGSLFAGIEQEVICNPNGLTLHYKYRSGGDPHGVAQVIVADKDNPWFNSCSKWLNSQQATWLEDSLLISITATTITITFEASGNVDGEQWLDIDDVYIE